MIAELQQDLRASDEPLLLEGLLARRATRAAIIVLFLAVLELIRLEAVIAVQQEAFGPVLLRKHKLFDVVFARPGKIAAIDTQYL